MTPADLVAEALAKAEDAVPQSIGKRHDQYVIVDEDRDIDDSGWGLSMMANEQHVSTRKPRVVYVRHDAMLAALTFLATRAAGAERRLAVMRDNVDSIRHTTRDAESIGDATRANAMAIDTLARDTKLAEESVAPGGDCPECGRWVYDQKGNGLCDGCDQ